MCFSWGWMEEQEWNVHSFKFSSLAPRSKSAPKEKSNRNGSLKVWNYQLQLLSLRPPVGLLSKINDLLKHNSLLCRSSGSRRPTKSLSWSWSWILRTRKHQRISRRIYFLSIFQSGHTVLRVPTWWGCVNRQHEMFNQEEISQSVKNIAIIIISCLLLGFFVPFTSVEKTRCTLSTSRVQVCVAMTTTWQRMIPDYFDCALKNEWAPMNVMPR